METEKQRIEELVKQLNAASAAYYNGQDEIMPNYEWDALFDELTTLEEKTGYIIKDSPTQNAGYEESGSGQKEPQDQTGGRTAAMGGSLSDLAVMETGRTYAGSDV